MEADLQRFLSALEENTRNLTKLQSVFAESNRQNELLTEQLGVMFEGDPKAKIPPLNIQINQLCYLLAQQNTCLHILITILSNATRLPRLLGEVARIFK